MGESLEVNEGRKWGGKGEKELGQMEEEVEVGAEKGELESQGQRVWRRGWKD